MNVLPQTLFNGLVASGIFLLVALGITVVFGLTRLVNFAHGQFLVVACFLASEVTAHGGSFWLALFAAAIGAGVIGYITERLAFRWTYVNPYNGLIVGLGLLTAMEGITVKIWGTGPVTVHAPFNGSYRVFGTSLSLERLLVLGVTVALTLILLAAIRFTPIGKKIRATHENPVAARHVGVNVARVITLTFVSGSVLAGFAGGLMGTLYPVSPYDGGALIIQGFVVALLGGLGSVEGAIIASVAYGIGETLVATYMRPTFVDAFTYVAVVAILIVRPTGLIRSTSSPEEAQPPVVKRRPPRSWTRAEQVALVVGGLAIPVVFFNMLPNATYRSLAILAAIYAVGVYAISIVYHMVGAISLAHNGLMAIGGYAAALIALHFGIGFLPALPIALVLGVVAGGLMAYPMSRAKGHYMLLVAFALGQIVIEVASNWNSLTLGDQGLSLIGRTITLGPFHITTLYAQFLLFLVFVVICAVVRYVMPGTDFGRRLVSISENDPLARSLGLNVRSELVRIFALTGGIAAVSGVLLAYYQQYVG
ncbi:MAG: ABC transporter permease, partial [Acidimicrobiales bacterium]|nr:ABC transporter permease [Acidimicrobiales bacterium]